MKKTSTFKAMLLDGNGNVLNLGAVLGGTDYLLALKVSNAVAFLDKDSAAVSCTLDNGYVVARA